MIIAALGPRMLRLAGKLADGAITAWTGPKALERHIVPGPPLSYGDLPAYRVVLERESAGSLADVCVFGNEQAVIAGVHRFAEAGATEFSVLPFGDAATHARTFEVLAAI